MYFSTSFKHLPKLNCKEIDLYLLYWLVTAQGGWEKVRTSYRTCSTLYLGFSVVVGSVAERAGPNRLAAACGILKSIRIRPKRSSRRSAVDTTCYSARSSCKRSSCRIRIKNFDPLFDPYPIICY